MSGNIQHGGAVSSLSHIYAPIPSLERLLAELADTEPHERWCAFTRIAKRLLYGVQFRLLEADIAVDFLRTLAIENFETGDHATRRLLQAVILAVKRAGDRK